MKKQPIHTHDGQLAGFITRPAIAKEVDLSAAGREILSRRETITLDHLIETLTAVRNVWNAGAMPVYLIEPGPQGKALRATDVMAGLRCAESGQDIVVIAGLEVPKNS